RQPRLGEPIDRPRLCRLVRDRAQLPSRFPQRPERDAPASNTTRNPVSLVPFARARARGPPDAIGSASVAALVPSLLLLRARDLPAQERERALEDRVALDEILGPRLHLEVGHEALALEARAVGPQVLPG